MCGGGGSSGPTAAQTQLQQDQLTQQAQASAAQLAEQQREFDLAQQQSADTLANTKAIQQQQEDQINKTAGLTQQWETGRAANTAKATGEINDAFSAFTPQYYAGFTKAYTDHYQPQIDRQFAQASNATDYGLARTGNLNSQTAADQFGQLAVQKGTAQEDVNNAAIGATTALRSSVLGAKQNLTAQATSDATLGSPLAPGSADAITASFNNTSSALKAIQSTAGDTISGLQATPQYSSLGSLFGTVAGTGGAAAAGNNNYNNYQAFNSGAGFGAASPNSTSGRVS